MVGLQKLERIRYDVDLDFISTYINRISVYREKNIKQMIKDRYIIIKAVRDEQLFRFVYLF